MSINFNKGLTFVVSLTILGSLVGCATEQNSEEIPTQQDEIEQGENQNQGTGQGEGNEQENEGDHNGEQAAQRPGTKEETIQIEGMDETFTFRLYEDQGLGLSTYIIDGMAVDSVSSSEGDAMIVYYDRDGERDPNASIQFFSPSSENQSKFDSQDEIIAWVESQDFTVGEEVTEENVEVAQTPGTRYLVDLNKEGQTYHGYVINIEKHNRMYLVFNYYLPEYGDGMGPRVHKLFEDLEWTS